VLYNERSACAFDAGVRAEFFPIARFPREKRVKKIFAEFDFS
jgi:hypothetical protein